MVKVMLFGVNSGQFGSNAVKFYFTLSYYFLLVFFKSLNFRKPPWKPFLGIFPSLKLFPSISNSFQLFSQKSFQMWEFCRFSLWGTHRKGLLLSLRLQIICAPHFFSNHVTQFRANNGALHKGQICGLVHSDLFRTREKTIQDGKINGTIS